MATLPAGYISQRNVPSASSSGTLGFIVCVKCCRMVDSVPIRPVDAGEMIMPALELGTPVA
jgi:hypothetical protein